MTIEISNSYTLSVPDNNGFLANAESLTPEGLMMYCQTQLGALDDDIQAYMAQQKASMAQKKVLQELKTELQKHNPTSDSGKNTATHQAITNAYKAAYEKLSDPESPAYNPEVAEFVKAEFYDLFPGGDIATGDMGVGKGMGKQDGDNDVPSDSKDAWQGRIDTIAGAIDDLKGNAELAMIQLQSIMSQRQTAIQLTTSMLDKYNKGLDMIAANFK